MLARLVLLSAILAAVLLAAGAAVVEPPRSDARLEVQTGSIRVQIAAPGRAFTLSPDTGCWQRGCPVFAVRARLFSAPAQSPEGEARRVQHLPAFSFER